MSVLKHDGALRTRLLRAWAAAAVFGVLAVTGCSAQLSVDVGGSKNSDAESDRRPSQTAEPEASGDQSAGASSASETSSCADGSVRRDLRMAGPSGVRDYRGHVIEPHGAEYDLRATVTDDGCTVGGTFEYVELECSGAWSQVGIEDGSRVAGQPASVRVRLAENVTTNPRGACAAAAEVTLLTGPAGTFYFSSWVRADGDATELRTFLEPQN